MSVQTGGMEFLKSIALLLASDQGLIVLSAEDEAFISQALSRFSTLTFFWRIVMTTAKRDYKKEYKEYHGKPAQIKARAERNAARAKLGLKVGDKRECDHKNPISKGGSNRKDNLRAVSRTTNRAKGAKRK